MPTAFIHAGHYKTGSSTFQRFAMSHRSWLHARGIYVPKAGTAPNGNHHALVYALTGLRSDPDAQRILREFSDELASLSGENILISSELLAKILSVPELLERLAGHMTRVGYSVVVIVYMRDLLPVWNSAYTQRVKNFTYHRSFDDFVEDRLRHYDEAPLWPVLLGCQEIRAVIRPYNRTVRKAGIVRSLLRELDLHETPPDVESVNLSPGPLYIHACRHMARRAFLGGAQLMPDGNRLTPWVRMSLRNTAERLLPADEAPYRGITPELELRVNSITSQYRKRMAREVWGQAWSECFPSEPNESQPNDLDLVTATDEQQSLIDSLEPRMNSAVEFICDKSHSVPVPQSPTNLSEFLQKAGFAPQPN